MTGPQLTLALIAAAGGLGWLLWEWLNPRRRARRASVRAANLRLRDLPWVDQLDDDDRPRRRQRSQHPSQHSQRSRQRQRPGGER